MGLWRNVTRMFTGGSIDRSAGLQSSVPAYSDSAAVPVTVDTALQLSAVWACVKIITETLGTMPIKFYKVADNGTLTPYPDHPLALLFRNKPNKWQTRQQFMESIIFQLALLGNDYSYIQRNSRKEIIQITPLMTTQMQVELLESGNIDYQYLDSGRMLDFKAAEIWHNKLYGNGIVGLSPLGYARNSVGIGQAAEKSVNKIYKNGGKPSGILSIDKVLTKEQRNAIKDNFSELSEGNTERLFVLEADMKYQNVSLSPSDIELLASRRFQIEDICRFWGVPSILVNDNQQTTAWGTGISQIIEGFHKFTIRPYALRYQESMRCNLLRPEERDTVAIRFDFKDLLEPSYSDRVKSAKEGVTGGLITPNEFRSAEGLKPLEGGDDLYLQQQMTPIKILDKINRSTTPPNSGNQADESAKEV